MKIILKKLAIVTAMGCAQLAQATVLMAGTNLSNGQALDSNNGLYHLVMQTDGNLVIYRGFPGMYGDWVSKWDSSTRTRGYFARMQEDGNFVVYNAGGGYGGWEAQYGNHAWNPGYRLTLGDDGTLAIRDSNFSLLKKITEDTCNGATGPVFFAYPAHTYSNGVCVDQFTTLANSGCAARQYAAAMGGVLGRCSAGTNAL